MCDVVHLSLGRREKNGWDCQYALDTVTEIEFKDCQQSDG